jgi:hypothetical protein
MTYFSNQHYLRDKYDILWIIQAVVVYQIWSKRAMKISDKMKCIFYWIYKDAVIISVDGLLQEIIL